LNNGRIFERNDSLLLTSEDKANGFSIVADSHHNITVLKWSNRVAWFSAVVTGGEVLLRRAATIAQMKLVKGKVRKGGGKCQNGAKK